MDHDEFLAKSPDDPLTRLVREDLDRLSVDELHRRVTLLKGEIARSEARIGASVNHRATADQLFSR